MDDEEADYKSRQQMLWEKYMFQCHCEKCLEEKAQLDEQENEEKTEEIIIEQTKGEQNTATVDANVEVK